MREGVFSALSTDVTPMPRTVPGASQMLSEHLPNEWKNLLGSYGPSSDVLLTEHYNIMSNLVNTEENRLSPVMPRSS